MTDKLYKMIGGRPRDFDDNDEDVWVGQFYRAEDAERKVRAWNALAAVEFDLGEYLRDLEYIEWYAASQVVEEAMPLYEELAAALRAIEEADGEG